MYIILKIANKSEEYHYFLIYAEINLDASLVNSGFDINIEVRQCSTDYLGPWSFFLLIRWLFSSEKLISKIIKKP